MVDHVHSKLNLNEVFLGDMERIGDEETVNDITGNMELKRKDCNLHLKPEGHNMLESPIMCAPLTLRSDLPESSLQDYTNAIEAGDSHRCVASLVGSEPPCTSLSTMNNTRLAIEELTVGNYRGLNSALVSNPSSNLSRQSQSQWQNLHQLASESGYKALLGDSMSQDQDRIMLGVREQYMKMNSNMQNLNFLSRKQVDQKPEDFSPYTRARDSIIISSNKMPIGGSNPLKTLSANGFSQLFVKRNLKGKGVINRSAEARRDFGNPVVGQNDEKLGCLTKVASDSLLKSNPNNDLRSSHGVTRLGPECSGDGICLKELLKTGCQKRERAESLHIFRQIVELVDSAQSQGLALKDLRPSYLYLWPSNRVIYSGSFIKRDSESAANQDINKKRPLEQDMQVHFGFGAKHQKLSDDMKFLTHQPQFNSSGSYRTKKPNENDFYVNGSQDYGVDAKPQKLDDDMNSLTHQPRFTSSCTYGSKKPNENDLYLNGSQDFGLFDVRPSTTPEQQSFTATAKLEEKWYSSPEELNDSNFSFSSNIYGLGVLLFELLCHFESSEVHSAVMSNLRHRILPSRFLAENPKEAGFCLWLLHPDPSSRPKTRKILQSELTRVAQELHSQDDLLVSTDEDEANSEILVNFLVSLKEQKQKHASKLVENIRILEEDIKEVEERYLQRTSSVFSQTQRECHNTRKKSSGFEGPTTSIAPSQSFSVPNTNEARLMRNINQLETAYFSIRSQIRQTENSPAGRSDKDLLLNRDRWCEVHNKNVESNKNQKSADHLGNFFEGFCKFNRYSKFEVCGTLRNGDLLNSPNVICSLSFDRDEEYIAAAGVSKRIKIFEYNSLLSDSIDIHYPVVEMSNKSKLSCACWNNYIKNYLASTDYDGVVQIWDAGTGQGISRYIEHPKRAWSVDFSQVDPTRFASGSDDCSVKMWSINEKNSAVTIGNPANVCCVQFSAISTHLLAFGSADYKVYCYDLRNTRKPWCTLTGHEKAVSYVKFLDSETLVSASTDNTLKLWDLKNTNPLGLSSSACSLTLRGHTNEKNFVGLSVSDGYIACGSETNEVYSYYRSLPMPITSHKFGSTDPISGHEIGDDNGQFVSSVCWRQKSNMVVAANSSGNIKLLQMVQ